MVAEANANSKPMPHSSNVFVPSPMPQRGGLGPGADGGTDLAGDDGEEGHRAGLQGMSKQIGQSSPAG
jgi:hypothetical protein